MLPCLSLTQFRETDAKAQLFQSPRPAADPYESFRGIGVRIGEGEGSLLKKAPFPLPNNPLPKIFG